MLIVYAAFVLVTLYCVSYIVYCAKRKNTKATVGASILTLLSAAALVSVFLI